LTVKPFGLELMEIGQVYVKHIGWLTACDITAVAFTTGEYRLRFFSPDQGSYVRVTSDDIVAVAECPKRY
jgi:hypothetical protein